MNSKSIKFTLKGRTAFFKKPDVNAKTYFTYNNIHKIALMGILGAVIGLGGYTDNKSKIKYPEFYEKLFGIKVSIIPESSRGYFSKKIQYFNNTVGYASQEAGGTLQVFEQWLENPNWTIYIANDGAVEKDIWDKLVEYLMSGQAAYIPYLGKNEHPAEICNVEYVDLRGIESSQFINSIMPVDLKQIEVTETIEENPSFVLAEMMPYELEPYINFYKFRNFVFTNCKIKTLESDVLLYSHMDKVLAFF